MPKQGTNFHLAVQVVGTSLTNVDSIEILFKQNDLDTAKALKTSLWKSDGSGDAQSVPGVEDTISIPWTREETYRFKRGSDFYMDARIHYAVSGDEPEVPIVKLNMNPSLFAKDEEVT